MTESADLERIERQERAARLRWSREKQGLSSPRAAAREFGWNENTYKAHESGRIGFPLSTGREYARRLKVDFGWLMTGEGAPQPRMTIPLIGIIGAGEEIYPIDDEPMGGGEPIEAPPGIGPDAIAVMVRGNSMYPDLDDGDIIVYDRYYESDFETFVGRRVVVALADGRRFVKRLRRGSGPGLYTLESSNPREPLIENVRVAWIAPIAWIRPKW